MLKFLAATCVSDLVRMKKLIARLLLDLRNPTSLDWGLSEFCCETQC